MIIRGAIKGFKSMVSSLVTNPGFGFASPRVCHQELTHVLKPYNILAFQELKKPFFLNPVLLITLCYGPSLR